MGALKNATQQCIAWIDEYGGFYCTWICRVEVIIASIFFIKLCNLIVLSGNDRVKDADVGAMHII